MTNDDLNLDQLPLDADADADAASDSDSPLPGDYLPVERGVPTEFITGEAGSGKSYQVMERAAADPEWALLTSTTGVSAVNLGCTTINSAVGYFDEDSLRDLWLQGRLTTKLRELASQGYRNLLVEECSMLGAGVLDILYQALAEVARMPQLESPLGLILVGDFAQLPVVKGRWAFEADCWSKVAANTRRLTHVWRQADPEFLAALRAARRGQGGEAAARLTSAGLRWETGLDTEFDGTTILSKNDQVARYNVEGLRRVKGAVITVASRRWGKQRSEWGQNKRTGEWGVPPAAEFKVGALVMLLANKFVDGELVYANGDLGHVEGYEGGEFAIKLVRNAAVVKVGRLTRSVAQRDRPDGWQAQREGRKELVLTGYVGRSHKAREGYVLGQLEYYPVRLAYASTVHRSQGLSLDRAQIDIRDRFFSSPAMCYVSLSRARTLGGLRLVGMRERFEQHCKADPRVEQFL